MIEKIRKPKKSRNVVNYIVYALIFGMIIATFVFMIPGLGGDGGGAVNAAAEVGETSISLRDYNDQLKRTRAQYSKLFNGEIPPYFEQNLKVQVLEGLVKREVLNQYAESHNLIVSPVEISDFIKKEIPAFQEDGEFSYSRYNTYLTNSRSTAKKFEGMIYKDIASRRLYDMFSNSLSKSKEEAVLAKSAENIEVGYSFVSLKNAELQNAVKISEEVVADFIKDSGNKKLLVGQYTKMEGAFNVPPKVELGYILVKDQAKALEMVKTLTAENFKDVAKEKSEDLLSKNKGGDLGEITRGSFSPEIEAKAFSMKKGEISAPFKTGLGYAILHVRNSKPKSVRLLDEVKPEVARAYLQIQGVSVLKKNLLEAAKIGSTDFDKKLNEAGLKWSSEQKFSLGETALPGIGESDEIADKLLSLGKNELYKNIVSFKESEYFIKLNSLVEKAVAAEAKTAQNSTTGRGGQLIDTVYQDEKERLNIELNKQLLK